MGRQSQLQFSRYHSLFVDPSGPVTEACLEWVIQQYHNLTYGPSFCILNNNCETFVNYCRTGRRYSVNGQRTKMVILGLLVVVASVIYSCHKTWRTILWSGITITFIMTALQCTYLTSQAMLLAATAMGKKLTI
eukprot:TRINITY_DN1577_c0_g1_i2.p1 TRINITY_DN1577_c0_g1~~TRINITY_DN1577_c0_g1_i2.p1  ORF type:complete len:134 (-),score=13.55 TRINITY_DN1577_c0_g1_i2:52-453(-)